MALDHLGHNLGHTTFFLPFFGEIGMNQKIIAIKISEKIGENTTGGEVGFKSSAYNLFWLG